MKVFISSTSEDLKDYRSVVQQLVLEAQWQPVGMEHFPSDPRPIVQLCRETLSSCDLVILLQGSDAGGFQTRTRVETARHRLLAGKSRPPRNGVRRYWRSTSVVGSRPAGRTPEGLDDMAGNVWEWCRDWYGPYRTEDSRDPLGPTPSKSENSPRRTRRGGAFNLDFGYQHSTYRSRLAADSRSSTIGFRVVSSGVRR